MNDWLWLLVTDSRKFKKVVNSFNFLFVRFGSKTDGEFEEMRVEFHFEIVSRLPENEDTTKIFWFLTEFFFSTGRRCENENTRKKVPGDLLTTLIPNHVQANQSLQKKFAREKSELANKFRF
jgi:hypothetical protein